MAGYLLPTLESLTGARSIAEFAADPTGTMDATADIQSALNAGAGGVVIAPPGIYAVAGQINIPKGTQFVGPNEGPFANSYGRTNQAPTGGENAIADQLQEGDGQGGAWIYLTGNAGNASGAAAVTVNNNSYFGGFSVNYPNQLRSQSTPTAYPFAILMQGNNPTVENVQLLNPYQGISANVVQRCLVRNISGQPLYLGLSHDNCVDCARFENIHWNPWWCYGNAMSNWTLANGTGFAFYRSDWFMMNQCFAFNYATGFYFDQGGNIVVPGQPSSSNCLVTNSGADGCNLGLDVASCLESGGLELVNFNVTAPSSRLNIHLRSTNAGLVKLIGGGQWVAGQGILVDGGQILLNGFHFDNWVGSAVTLGAGTVGQVIGCSFDKSSQVDVTINSGVTKALVTGNLKVGAAFSCVNNGGSAATVANNF